MICTAILVHTTYEHMRVNILFQITHLNFWHLNLVKIIDLDFESIQKFLFSGPKSDYIFIYTI